MKAKFLSIIALAAFGIVAAAACNKPETETDIAAEVAGTYTGTASASFQYSPDPMVTENETFSITAAGDKLVDVSYESATWGSFGQDPDGHGRDQERIRSDSRRHRGKDCRNRRVPDHRACRNGRTHHRVHSCRINDETAFSHSISCAAAVLQRDFPRNL